MASPLLDKSLEFATQIVLFYEAFSKTRKDTTITKQLLRSATSIGANINEAVYGNSKADFISKLHIALKETGESIYWLTLLKRTQLMEYDFDSLLSLADEIKRLLIASLNRQEPPVVTALWAVFFFRRITEVPSSTGGRGRPPPLHTVYYTGRYAPPVSPPLSCAQES